jgi:non-canonical purine NTP pyrophosphatase (RdgB/HAM1 family)
MVFAKTNRDESKKNQIIFATNNLHKIEEVRHILGDRFPLMSLEEAGIITDIPEDHTTLEENAIQKAQYIFRMKKTPVFADDTGLEVEALNGLPGVYSARYAGEEKISSENVKKLLLEMKGVNNRNARFRCIVAFVSDGVVQTFEGIVNGKITREKSGSGGFGYDPVFVPDGYNQTFAELKSEIKNKISHRAIAVMKLNDYLKKTIV